MNEVANGATPRGKQTAAAPQNGPPNGVPAGPPTAPGGNPQAPPSKPPAPPWNANNPPPETGKPGPAITRTAPKPSIVTPPPVHLNDFKTGTVDITEKEEAENGDSDQESGDSSAFRKIRDKKGERACYQNELADLADRIRSCKTIDDYKKHRSALRRMKELARKVDNREMVTFLNGILSK